MNEDLKSLYRDTLLEHSRQPRNREILEDPSTSAELKNPLCGDQIAIYLDLSHNTVKQATFDAQCCSICMASASMLTEAVSDTPTHEARKLASSLIDLLNDSSASLDFGSPLDALSGVKTFPSRIRCATLPWEAMLQALETESPE